VRAAICRWQAAGLSVATVSARWLVLRSAMSWAVAEGVLRTNPLAGMRGPARPEPRKHHSPVEVRLLLGTAEILVAKATTQLSAKPTSPRYQRALFAAEQDLLLVRLAADSGARRGELAVLRLGDLDGRVLTIERGLSRGVLGTTKSSRARRLTLGRTTAALVRDHVSSWEQRWPEPLAGDWLFAPDPTRTTYLTADALSHRFGRLGEAAGVSGAALHRLRLAVGSATVTPPPRSGITPTHGTRGEEVADELDDFLNSRDATPDPESRS
jgi:integrase